jgi:RNA polymerase sigma-70 factor (ECF subfamily)
MQGELISLIRRSLAGDEAAFGAIFHQYKNLVFKTAYLMLGEQREAEDVLQEVFVKVHRALATYQPERGAFTTWLHRITINNCLALRRQRRLIVVSLEELALRWLNFELVAPPQCSSDDAVSVQRSLVRLSPKLRAVVVLRFYWDMSYGDIAMTLDIPVGTVKSRLNAALDVLRRDLNLDFEAGAAASEHMAALANTPGGVQL